MAELSLQVSLDNVLVRENNDAIIARVYDMT